MNFRFIILESVGNWGERAETWIVEQASAAAVIALVIACVPLFFKQMWRTLAGTFFLGAIALFFINNPSKLEAIGTTVYDIVFK